MGTLSKNSSPHAFSSWSGGKDSCLALHLAEKAGYEAKFLLNMLTEDREYWRSHGLRRSMLERQADAMGRQILFGRAGWENYEPVFRQRLESLPMRRFSSAAQTWPALSWPNHRYPYCSTAPIF